MLMLATAIPVHGSSGDNAGAPLLSLVPGENAWIYSSLRVLGVSLPDFFRLFGIDDSGGPKIASRQTTFVHWPPPPRALYPDGTPTPPHVVAPLEQDIPVAITSIETVYPPFPILRHLQAVKVTCTNRGDADIEANVLLTINGRDASYIPVRLSPGGSVEAIFVILFDAPNGDVISALIVDKDAIEIFGAELNPTGSPIGGGEGYADIIARDDPRVRAVVSDREGLLQALSQAKSGDVVYIEENAAIDLTGLESGIGIPEGVTLASNRGEKGSPGGRIFYTSSDGDDPNFIFSALHAEGRDVRITGLRLEGPFKETRRYNLAIGIHSTWPGLEVDNCEIFGWSYAGIALQKTGPENGGYFHHNHIHHCRTNGYGYGILIGDQAFAQIEANAFDYTRHCISGSGMAGDGYEARYNMISDTQTSAAFDMHGDPRGSGTAGAYIHIHHNTFLTRTSYAIAIRGVPSEGARIHNNWFSTPNPVGQKDTFGNIVMQNNIFGQERTLVNEGPVQQYTSRLLD